MGHPCPFRANFHVREVANFNRCRLFQRKQPLIYQARGFVLISVLLLLAIMTILTLASFESARLSFLTASAYLQKIRAHDNLLFQLKQVAKKIAIDPNICLVKTMPVSAYFEENAKGWRRFGCLQSRVPFETYFVNEVLAGNFCRLNEQNILQPVTIHRITLVSVLPEQAKFVLQSTILQAELFSGGCHEVIRAPLGRMQGLRWG